jgi:predicted DNA-binding ribbon-helix-helix protein
MKRLVAKHSVTIHGRKTSVSLEAAFWSHLKQIAHTQQAPLRDLIARIDETRDHSNLSSAIRLFVLGHFQTNRSSQSGHGLRE